MVTSMLVQMGFKRLVDCRLNNGYERLVASTDNEKTGGRSSPRRRLWVRKMNGRFKGVRLMRSRKLNWKAFSLVRKIAGIYGNIANRLKMMDSAAAAGAYPAIVFCGQWGLPVLSHSNANCRRNASWL